MQFQRTTDYELVKRIVTDPSIYPFVADDLSPKPAEWQPVCHELIWYVLAVHEGESVGMLMLMPRNSIHFDCHVCMLQSGMGKALDTPNEFVSWVWENTPCRRMTASIPAFNRAAIRFALRGGMAEFGKNPDSFLKHGKLHPQILLGVTKAQGDGNGNRR